MDFIKKSMVSIHAPVWGATLSTDELKAYLEFQSTHPCGVRPVATDVEYLAGGFNPRTRVGCDGLMI